MKDTFSIHVRSMTGLEKGLAQELTALGAEAVRIQKRVVICEGDKALMYRANLWCRAAIRVLRPIASFAAPNEKALYDGLQSIDWAPWLTKPTGSIAIDTDVWSSFTTHSLFLSQLSKDAIVDQLREKTGKRPSVDLRNPDLRIVLSVFQDHAQVFADSSGESLHRRGYRLESGEAPLKESLAAGIIQLTGWEGTTPLLDPMCGSGTLLIEAGLKLRNIAPGLSRPRFGFQSWTDYDAALFEDLRVQAKAAIRKDATASIKGFDINPATVKRAQGNVERAGLLDLIQIETGDFFKLPRPETAGTLVVNPPYDERLTISNAAGFYEQMGDTLQNTFRGWKAFVFTGNPVAAKHITLKKTKSTLMFNGSIECKLYEYPLGDKDQAHDRQQWREHPEANPQWQQRKEVFANRLKKNLKHYSRWAQRENIQCWRLYDWDIPELPFMVDIFGDQIHFAEVPRNYDHSPSEHAGYLKLMLKAAADVVGVPLEKAYLKERRPRKTGGAAKSVGDSGQYTEVQEGGHRFLVNLSDYLEVGLYLDHRKTRALVEKEAKGKDFLNLYGYTGASSVYAAAGGAKSTTTVDTAGTYLDWARENLNRNGFSNGQHRTVKSDTLDFLERTDKHFDLCIVDPPARSTNRKSGGVFEIQTDHVVLLKRVMDRMRPGGKIIFTTSYRSFELNEKALKEGRNIHVKEISGKTISPDFQRKSSQRCWEIQTLQ